ncbi:hypothetical protein OS493_011406, partial [Desmophyllum pertusum]
REVLAGTFLFGRKVKTRMNDKHRDILRRNWASIRDDLEIEELLPHLVDVLGPADQEKVQAEATRREKIDKLFDIIPRKGPEGI